MSPTAWGSSTLRVIDAAVERGLRVTVRRLPEGTRTAADAAGAVGCEVGAIVKSIVCASDQGPVLVLTSGVNRVDYDKVAAHLGRERVTRADAALVREATGYAIGGTAPFGHPGPLPTLIDADLMAHDEVWAAAGTPDTVFAVSPEALVDACDAPVADVRA